MVEFFREPKEFEEKIVQVNRVSKKTAGGNRIGFSVVVVVGNKKGRVGVGIGKAPEVQEAIRKGVAYAKKHLLTVPLKNGTIPHPVSVKFGAAHLILKPAPSGSGVIAGGSVRAVVELAGIKDISSKVLGTNNKANNVYATFKGLGMLKGNGQPKTNEAVIAGETKEGEAEEKKKGGKKSTSKASNTITQEKR